MLFKFIVVSGLILALGPGYTEGGFEKIEQEGVVAVAEQVWEDREEMTQEEYMVKLNNR